MDRTLAVLSTAIGTGLALRFGPGVGQSLYPYEATAALRGMGLVGGSSAFGSYVLLQRLRWDYAVSFAFGAVVAYYYGQMVGYRFFFAHDDLQAKIYGMPMTFMFAAVPGELIVWPIVRQLGNAARTALDPLLDRLAGFMWTLGPGWFATIRGKPGNAARGRPTPYEIWESIENGRTLAYYSRVDRDFTYFEGRNRKKRLRMGFNLRRDTMAMSPRERAAFYILLMLARHGLDDRTADRLLFALTWGNGACIANWDQFTTDPRVLQPLGLRTGEDVIRHEATVRGANVESAISELFGLLRARASRKDAPEELVKLQQSYHNPGAQPGGDASQWS